MYTIYGQSVVLSGEIEVLDVYTESPHVLHHGWINVPMLGQVRVHRLQWGAPWRAVPESEDDQ